ncbi:MULTISPECIES: universal stress protein [Amycolatopsis]|uniref:Universal stress protein n=1 Tax=Amycolatopsis dendrobii TaxID=2760662 RepID=A0A7W3ZFC8_9PSEU|nr:MULTISPECIES: universal stress protein [Amycolatopsis]MBB1159491.1 universal stress protein [Amycolatopsis dendrobii]UKD57424.1 universal stress protein [Amycolatopsis sp. FU40]
MTANKPGDVVLVGIDESETSLTPVRWAAAEAKRRDCRLELFHAGIGETVDVPAKVAERKAREVFGRAHRWLSRAAEVAEDAAPGVRTQLVARVGFAADLLIELSRSVSLVVLGSHGLGGLRGAAIGSVALRVAASASCPVVVVRGRAAPGGAVVVGVDGADGAEHVLEFAFDAAASRQAPLVAVRAWHAALVDEPGRADAEERALRERIGAWAEKYPAVETRALAVRDRSAARALMTVEGAQLVVIGSRGRGPVAGGLLGSTGNRLLAHSACPVAVVH